MPEALDYCRQYPLYDVELRHICQADEEVGLVVNVECIRITKDTTVETLEKGPFYDDIAGKLQHL